MYRSMNFNNIDFLGGPVVKTLSFHCRELNDFIPGGGTMIERCPRHCPTTKNKKERKTEKSVKTILSLRAVQRRGTDVLPIPPPSPPLPLPTLSWVVVWGLRSSSPLAFLHISRPTLSDPRDGSPPGSPIPGILQARTLEWVAIRILCWLSNWHL